MTWLLIISINATTLPPTPFTSLKACVEAGEKALDELFAADTRLAEAMYRCERGTK